MRKCLSLLQPRPDSPSYSLHTYTSVFLEYKDPTFWRPLTLFFLKASKRAAVRIDDVPLVLAVFRHVR